MVGDHLAQTIVLLREEQLLNSSSSKLIKGEGGGVEAKSFQVEIHPLFKVTFLQGSLSSAGGGENKNWSVRRDFVDAVHDGHVGQCLDGTEHGIVRGGEWNFLGGLVELECLGGGDPDVDGVADPGEGAQVRTRRLSNLRRLIGTKLFERNINKK